MVTISSKTIFNHTMTGVPANLDLAIAGPRLLPECFGRLEDHLTHRVQADAAACVLLIPSIQDNPIKQCLVYVADFAVSSTST